MPTYEYACDSCGHQFETFQSMKDEPLRICPRCEEATLRRLIFGGTGVIFKGSGFYVNDSKKSARSSTTDGAKKASVETSASSDTSSETKPSTESTPAQSKPEKTNEKQSTVPANSKA